MKKNHFLSAVLTLVILVLTGILVTRTNTLPQMQPTAVVPEALPNENTVYDHGGVRVVTASLPQMPVFSPAGQQATEWSGVVQIFDGGTKPMNFTYAGDVVPFVETVTADSIVIPMGTEHGVHDVYVADRHADGRLVMHYTFPNERYLASSHDVKFFVLTDNKDIIIRAIGPSALTEQKRFSSTIASQAPIASMSPDDAHVAFAIQGGTLDQPHYTAYVFDLKDGSIQKVGESSFIQELVWKDNQTLVNVLTNNVGGVEKRTEQETFKLTQ